MNDLRQEKVDDEEHNHGREPSDREGDEVASSVSLILDKSLDIDEGDRDIAARMKSVHKQA